MPDVPSAGALNYWIAPALVLALMTSTASGQQPAGDPPALGIRALPKTFLTDEKRIWTSPFRRDSYSSNAIKRYVIPFAIIAGALIASDRKTAALLPNTTDQSVWSGRVSQLGSGYSLAGFSGATYLIGQLSGNSHASEAGLLALEALGHTQIAVFAVKQITNRERPLDHDSRGGFWEGGNSFPSGHAAGSFAVATVFAYEYREHLAIPIAAYSLATLISASRLSAQRHWVSDIFVGASAGFLIGRFTYRRNHNPNLPGSVVRRSGRVIPQVGLGGARLTLTWHL
jgi:membrane-associated phospholipid phosphatase